MEKSEDRKWFCVRIKHFRTGNIALVIVNVKSFIGYTMFQCRCKSIAGRIYFSVVFGGLLVGNNFIGNDKNRNMLHRIIMTEAPGL